MADLQDVMKTRGASAAQSNVTPLASAAAPASVPAAEVGATPAAQPVSGLVGGVSPSGNGSGSGAVVSTTGPGSAINNTNNLDAINQMYDARRASTLSGLQAAYEQNLSNSQAARNAISGTYQTQANDMAAQYERNRRNLNEQAAANGINTGAGSQQRLALQNVWNRDYGRLRASEAGDIAEADRGIADLQNQYQISIQQAVAENDYNRAAALLDEYNNIYNRNMQQAQTLASYGDFSGYASLYGEAAANNMRQAWIAKNPLLAYNTGAINAATYYKMTGKYAPGYEPEQSYGGGGGSRNSTKKSGSTVQDQYNALINAGAKAGTLSNFLYAAKQEGLIDQNQYKSMVLQHPGGSGR